MTTQIESPASAAAKSVAFARPAPAPVSAVAKPSVLRRFFQIVAEARARGAATARTWATACGIALGVCGVVLSVVVAVRRGVIVDAGTTAAIGAMGGLVYGLTGAFLGGLIAGLLGGAVGAVRGAASAWRQPAGRGEQARPVGSARRVQGA